MIRNAIFILTGIFAVPATNALFEPEVRTVTVEHIYRHTETVFEEPITVTPGVGREAGTPIAAAHRVFGAMLQPDFDAWLAGWADESRARMLGVQPGESPSSAALEALRERRTTAWRGALGDASIRLIAQCDAKRYALISFEIRRQGTKAPTGDRGIDTGFAENGVWRDTVCFVERDGEWLQTNQYADHPIQLMWWSGQDSIQVIAKDE